jgi:hemolysin activation/secretion protein
LQRFARKPGYRHPGVVAFTAAVLVLWCQSPASAKAPPPVSVQLDEIRVDGNTVLDPRAIEETVYPFLGPDRTATDIEHARAALAALYRDRGYQTVAVVTPPQRVTQGIVYLTVIEQPIERLRVVGARHVEPAVLKRQAPSLHKGKVPNFNAVKRDIARLNALPDRTVTPAFRPGRAPNTVDVDLDVQDSLAMHGTLELDNRRSVDTTSLRLNGSLSYDNFFQRGDTANIFFQVAPENTNDSRVLGGSYLFHVPDSVLSVLASYVNSDSNVTTVGDLSVVGKGQIATVQLQVPLGLQNNFIQSFTAAIAYKDLGENDILGAASQAPGSAQYPLTYYPVTLGYEGDWISDRSRTSLTAAVTLGLSGLGSQDAQFNDRRKYADQNFSYLRVNLSRTQDLPHGVQLYADASGQASADSLVSTEQFNLGGLDTVRGYLESEALGDQGADLQLEARSPSIAKYLSTHIDSWRFHLFADIGNVSIHRALIGQASSYTLSSVGIGTRVTLFGYLNASLEDAYLLSRGPDSQAGSDRVLFRLYGSF